MKLTKLLIFCFSSILFSVYGQAQDVTVKGRIYDEKGLPIPAATILIKGTSRTSASDIDGNYEIKAPANGTLMISYIGYSTIQEPLNGRTNVDFRLKPESQDLKEVVVIGYGTQKKKDITSAIATVSVTDISSRPIVNAAEAITGKAAGVQVSTSSGSPGGQLSIRVRGVGSPNGGEPLYVIDGVIAPNLNAIDPNNIKSISVLKDASAAGIYGAAGSTNGVVIITSKEGVKGKATSELTTYTAIQSVTKKLGVLNNEQYLALQSEIGGTASVPNYYDVTNTNNNWQDLIYRNAIQKGINFNTSGGSETGKYYLGLGYVSQDGIIRGSDFERYSAKFNTSQEITKNIKLGANIDYNRTYQSSITDNASQNFGGVVASAITMPEFVPVFFPVNSPNSGLYGTSPFQSGENALANIESNENLTIGNNVLANAFVELTLPFNFKFKSQFNVVNTNSRTDTFRDPFSTGAGLQTGGNASSYYTEVFRWGLDNTLSWNKRIGNHGFDATIGTAALKETIFNSFQTGEGFGSSVVHTLNAATKNKTINTGNYDWTTNSYFGRLNYAFDDRYLATVTYRRDGSSRVGQNARWGSFPAVSAGWKVSNEKFMENVNWVKNFKVRAGWGKTGNLPPYTLLYPSYSLFTPRQFPYNGGAASAGTSPAKSFGNPDLKWESAIQTNLGFDMSFFKENLTLTVDLYHKKVEDLIFTQPLPLTTGDSEQALNLPGNNINKGIEISLDANIIKSENFYWTSNFNISFNKNVIEGIDENVTFPTGGVTVGGARNLQFTQIIKNGLPLGTFWGIKSKGVDPQTGNLVYGDAPEVIGQALPKYTFGFTNEFKYKNFNLSMLIDGTQGNDIYNGLRMETESMRFGPNQSTAVLNRWKQPGDITNIPRALGNATSNSADAALLGNVSSHYLEDGSFIRLRNVTLGYSFDRQLIDKLGLSAMKLYVTGQNLITITNYSGYYPEVNAYGQGTNNQSTGAGSGASLLSLGIDRGTYPTAKTYTLGLNVQF